MTHTLKSAIPVVLFLTCGFSIVSGADTAPSGDSDVIAQTQSPFLSLADFSQRLLQLEMTFADRHDPRAVFAAMYVVLTQNGIEAIERGDFEDGDWVGAFMLAFGNFYRQALFDYESGNRDRVPDAWIVAFDTAAEDSVTVFQHALLGIHAHINRDMGYALAEVTPPCDHARRSVDFARTNRFIVESIDAVEESVAKYDTDLGNLDTRLRRADERLLKQVLTQWRFGAWRRAKTIGALGSGPALDFYSSLLNHITGQQAMILRDSDAIFALGDASGVSSQRLAPKHGQGFARGHAQPVLVQARDGRVFEVDLDGDRPVAHGNARKIGRRVDDARRADADDGITCRERGAGAFQHAHVERVLKPHNVRTPIPAACASPRIDGHLYIRLNDTIAIAPHAPEAAVQFDDPRRIGPASLVQAVNVLRDDDRRRFFPKHLRDDAMAVIRFARRDALTALVVEVPDLLRVAVERTLARVVLVVVLLPNPAVPAVRGDAALRRQPRAREEDDMIEILQMRNGGRGTHGCVRVPSFLPA